MPILTQANANSIPIKTTLAQVNSSAQLNSTAQVTGLDSEITSINNDISTVNGEITTIQGEVSALQTNVGTVNTEITTIQGDISTLNADVSTLQNDVSTINGEITTINGQISTIDADIVTIKDEVLTLQTDVSTINGEITTIQGNIFTLQTDVATIEGNITTINGEIATLQGDVTTLQGDVATLQGDVSTINGDISTINTELAGKLDKSGGTMTGDLILNADATQPLQAVTYQQLSQYFPSLNVVYLTADKIITQADNNTIFMCENALDINFLALSNYSTDFNVTIKNFSNSPGAVINITAVDQIEYNLADQLLLSRNQSAKIVPATGNWVVLDSANDGATFYNIFNINSATGTLVGEYNRGIVELTSGNTAKTLTIPNNAIEPINKGFAAIIVNKDTAGDATLVASGSDIFTGNPIVNPLSAVLLYKSTYGSISRWIIIPYFVNLQTDGFLVNTAGALTARQIVESDVQNLTADLAAKLDKSGGTMTGALYLYGAATAPNEAITLEQAQQLAAGLNIHVGVKAASTTPYSAVYNNGASGVGATLTATANGVFVADGYTGIVGDRILIKNQVNAFENGVYDITDEGSISTPFILTRSSDYDVSGNVDNGDLIPISGGNTLIGQIWSLTATMPVVIGTTALNFNVFYFPVPIIAGTGISVTGSTVSIANTGVTAGTYGSASKSIVQTVNAQGQLTSATDTDIAITASQVTNFNSAAAAAAPVQSVAGRTGTVTLTHTDITDFNSATDGRIAAAVGVTVEAHSAELDALAALNTTGIVQRTGANTYTAGTITTASISDFTTAVDSEINSLALLKSNNLSDLANYLTALENINMLPSFYDVDLSSNCTLSNPLNENAVIIVSNVVAGNTLKLPIMNAADSLQINGKIFIFNLSGVPFDVTYHNIGATTPDAIPIGANEISILIAVDKSTAAGLFYKITNYRVGNFILADLSSNYQLQNPFCHDTFIIISTSNPGSELILPEMNVYGQSLIKGGQFYVYNVSANAIPVKYAAGAGTPFTVNPNNFAHAVLFDNSTANGQVTAVNFGSASQYDESHFLVSGNNLSDLPDYLTALANIKKKPSYYPVDLSSNQSLSNPLNDDAVIFLYNVTAGNTLTLPEMNAANSLPLKGKLKFVNTSGYYCNIAYYNIGASTPDAIPLAANEVATFVLTDNSTQTGTFQKISDNNAPTFMNINVGSFYIMSNPFNNNTFIFITGSLPSASLYLPPMNIYGQSLPLGGQFYIYNVTANDITIRYDSGGSSFTVPAGNFYHCVLFDNSTSNGQITAYAYGTASQFDESHFLVAANNLSDLNNVATARTNLGLGTAATQDSTNFASSATTIGAAGLLTGGGDLSANRTITLNNYNIVDNVITDNSANRTLGLTDGFSFINFTNPTGSTVTLPANATTAIPVGSRFILKCSGGANALVTLSLGGGVSLINSSASPISSETVGNGGYMIIQKIATNTWQLLQLQEKFVTSGNTFTGPWAAQTVQYSVVRNNNMIHLDFLAAQIGTTITAAGQTITTSIPIPARFRPAANLNLEVFVTNNVTPASSRMIINSATGVITIYATTALTNFGGVGSALVLKTAGFVWTV